MQVTISWAHARNVLTLAALCTVLVAATTERSQAQNQVQGGNNFQFNNVGGVYVDTEGVLRNAETDVLGKLRDMRRKMLTEVPADIAAPTELRKVSLRRLEEAIAKHLHDGQPLADEIRYLAGLQRIRYVLVYPEQNDIVLVGPAEGWKADDAGNVVGVESGRPVMQLEDLLVALRGAEAASKTTIGCSIDPTPQGVARMQAFLNTQNQIGPRPQETLDRIEESLGPQNITLTGIPADSRFARVLVAADYRMKRIAMNFDRSPVTGLKSYLQMISAKAAADASMMPRWWLAPNYAPMLKDADGLAWELRGASVKVMTEDDFVAANGVRTPSGKSSPVAQQWADDMTSRYDEIAARLPIFGELQNIMDLAIVAALITKNQLPEKAGYSFTTFADESALATNAVPVPKHVPTIASFVKKGRNYIISASGGVDINSWYIADQVETSDTQREMWDRSRPASSTSWWWN